jgi:hypothetical protein
MLCGAHAQEPLLPTQSPDLPSEAVQTPPFGPQTKAQFPGSVGGFTVPDSWVEVIASVTCASVAALTAAIARTTSMGIRRWCSFLRITIPP